MTRADIVAPRARADLATPGPWSYNGYSAVHSLPRLREYNAAESLIPSDAPADDPRWGELPETEVAYVPVRAGDTATAQGAIDAAFIAAARSDSLALADALLAAMNENERLRDGFVPEVEECHRLLKASQAAHAALTARVAELEALVKTYRAEHDCAAQNGYLLRTDNGCACDVCEYGRAALAGQEGEEPQP